MRRIDWYQQRQAINRRAFLRGSAVFAGGATVALGLPFLEGLPGRSAYAQSSNPVFGFFICTACGVAQETRNEPERFWPDQEPGELTTSGMQAYADDRCTGLLADHASRLLLVRGVNFPYGNGGCGHALGLCQALTASKPSPTDNNAQASGKSVDVAMYEAVNPSGVEGLNLYSGLKGGFIDERLSFKDGGMVRSAEGNPRVVYDRLIDGGQVDQDPSVPVEPSTPSGPSVGDLLALRRKSVNDLVREDLSTLLANSRLSADDRRRIDQHLSGIRDVEVTMSGMEADTPGLSCVTSGIDVAGIEAIGSGNAFRQDGRIEDVARLHFDLVTLTFACGLNRVACIQIGDGTDGTHYNIEGAQAERFHHISHRIRSDGNSGAAIEGAAELHAAIDRLRMETFKHLLDRWAEYSTPNGPMFDNAFVMWTNHVANGAHSVNNVPFLIAGNAGGFLKNGVYVDGGDTKSNRLLATMLTAGGVPVENFGGSDLTGGLMTELLA
jgi:hypothetical protein